MASQLEFLREIPDLDENSRNLTTQHINQLTKPPGSLGRLESIAAELAAMTGNPYPEVEPPGILVFAADHGIVEEGVSAFPQEITVKMAQNFLNQGAAINVFANQIGAHFQLIDVGMVSDLSADGINVRKIKRGTENFLKQDAMTKAEAELAIHIGYEEAVNMITRRKVRCLILGEMGIGNTTPSSAVTSVLSGKDPSIVTGPGTGLTKDKILHKQRILSQALKNRKINKADPLDVLAKVGGLEIAAMTGAMLAAACHRIPILIDGFISATAALTARAFAPSVTNYMFAGHRSTEPGHEIAVQLLGKRPLLDLDMRLGEGSGAAVSYPILNTACAMVKNMATFSDLDKY